MRYEVTIYSQRRSSYVSAFYAGLFELSAAGDVTLRFARRQEHRAAARDPVTLRIDVTAAGNSRPVKVCFDTADWRTVASMEDLLVADVYFKRSYDAPYAAQLDPLLGAKIVPLGLHYACSSRHESLSQSVRAAFAWQTASGAWSTAPLDAAKRVVASPIKCALGRLRAGNSPPFIDEFEAGPLLPAAAKVFYRTRVYGPKDAPDNFRLGRMDEVNELRANTVRALKSHFGDRFVGGLRFSAYTQATYPDCLYPAQSGLRGHVALGRACLINVNTAGLHDSTSWKIPEYMAASRCIVSEPTYYAIPAPVVEGRNYLPFTTPEGCVAACERLLADPAAALAMRRENAEYYRAHVRPDRLMARCLQVAVERCP
ncbi:MAG: glycosyltransferase [Gammaproteobacteria bacterium]